MNESDRDLAELNIGFFFGGVSPEHEVSVISSLQAVAALDRSRYRPVPVYIAKDGQWYTGDALLDVKAFADIDSLLKKAQRCGVVPGPGGKLQIVPVSGRLFRFGQSPRLLDVVFLGLHGGAGENGSIQGLCETCNVAYTGSGVFGSALGMDKVLSKMLCRDQNIPVVEWVALRETEWADREEEWLDRIEEDLWYPVIVKPARLGSSIGIAKAADRAKLDFAIEEAFRFDEKVVIERAVRQLTEVNCSVLGDPDEAIASVIEQPISASADEVLSFTDKYVREGGGKAAPATKIASGGAEGMASLDRIIPAPLSDKRAKEIRDLAVRVFKLFECAGVARIDFMIDKADDAVYFNEINTIPGSFSFYLWEPSGVPFPELLHRMIEIARKRQFDKMRHVQTYEVNLLSEKCLSGLKGAKKA
ncbi:MAG: D-alanine--D-alanine ligase [Bacteroidetes bacterium]|nr:D-alanine--D-alanine ligase [Bacteroidota bacterium]